MTKDSSASMEDAKNMILPVIQLNVPVDSDVSMESVCPENIKLRKLSALLLLLKDRSKDVIPISERSANLLEFNKMFVDSTKRLKNTLIMLVLVTHVPKPAAKLTFSTLFLAMMPPGSVMRTRNA